MKQISKTIVMALVLLAGSYMSGTAGEPDLCEIDVMSFNIRYGTAHDGENSWSNRQEQVYEVIRQFAPDVIGIQEALRFQLDQISEALPEYDEIGEGRDGGTEGEYSAILYRRDQFTVVESATFWLSDTPSVPSVHWGNACIRVCTWAHLIDKPSGKAFYLYNTHLDHESQPSRDKSVRLLMDTIANRNYLVPFIITGDFNAGEENSAIEYLKGTGNQESVPAHPVLDAFRVLHPDSIDVGTFNGFEGRSNGAKIDYIFVTPDTDVLEADIVRTEKEGQYPSDHYPVTARLRLVTGAERDK